MGAHVASRDATGGGRRPAERSCRIRRTLPAIRHAFGRAVRPRQSLHQRLAPGVRRRALRAPRHRRRPPASLEPSRLLTDRAMDTSHHQESLARRASALKSALGLIGSYLADDRTVEIMLNADGVVWVEQLGVGMIRTPVRMQPAEAERMLRLIASEMSVELNTQSPALSGKLPAPWGCPCKPQSLRLSMPRPSPCESPPRWCFRSPTMSLAAFSPSAKRTTRRGHPRSRQYPRRRRDGLGQDHVHERLASGHRRRDLDRVQH